MRLPRWERKKYEVRQLANIGRAGMGWVLRETFWTIRNARKHIAEKRRQDGSPRADWYIERVSREVIE